VLRISGDLFLVFTTRAWDRVTPGQAWLSRCEDEEAGLMNAVGGLVLAIRRPEVREPMRVPDNVLKSVAFLCVPDGEGGYAYRGTGFLVGVPSKTRPGRAWAHFVTARHCVEGPRRKGLPLHIRVNTNDGGSINRPNRL